MRLLINRCTISFMENGSGENSEKPQEVVALPEDRPLTKREKRELAKQRKQEEQSKIKIKSKSKKIVLYVIGVLLLGVGIYKIWQWINTPQSRNGSSDILSVKEDDWVKGNSDAQVTMIEYEDFECPACAIYSTEVVPKLEGEYKDKLRVVYRHFPLPQHSKAIDAAKAAEAAGLQGKFWEMHDLLFGKQSDWSSASNYKEKFEGYAESLGLNMDQYKSDLNSDSVEKSIKDNEDESYTLRINETPTFYINEKKASINNGYDDLKKAVDKTLGNDQ